MPDDNGLAIFKFNGLVSTEDQRAPRIGLRNVLASQLAQALGLSIIVKSEFSARSVPLTAEEIASSAAGFAASQTFSFGISMQGVRAVYGCVDDVIKLPTESETLITMIEESIDLQLFDAVIGQGDRHSRNIMVDKSGHVYGIDNDQCFPDENANDPEILALDNDGIDTGKRGTLLPRIITTGQRDKWLAMDEKTVFKSLRMATQKQRDAAIARFRKVQAYVRSLPNEQLVDRTRLISEPVMKILRTPAEFVSPRGRKGTGDTSYFGRYFE